MTRKDYEGIASVLRKLMLAGYHVRSAAMGIADYCQSDNSRFDREKFLVACGVSQADHHVETVNAVLEGNK